MSHLPPSRWFGWFLFFIGVMMMFALGPFLASTPAHAHAQSQSQTQPAAESPLRVLLVLAHPDDETMIGSFLIRLHELHADVRAIYATDGEGGRVVHSLSPSEKFRNVIQSEQSWVLSSVNIDPDSDKGAIHPETDTSEKQSSETIKSLRLRELENATIAYGISHVDRLHLPDVPLRDPGTLKPTRDVKKFLSSAIWDTVFFNQEVVRVANEFQPQFIITMSLDEDAHAHHKAVRILTESLYKKHKLGAATIGLYAISEEHWIKDGGREPRTSQIVFDTKCDDYAKRAFAAAQFHESQLPGHTGPVAEDEVIYKISGELKPFFPERFEPKRMPSSINCAGRIKLRSI